MPASLPASDIVLTVSASGIFLWAQTKEETGTTAATITSGNEATLSGLQQQSPIAVLALAVLCYYVFLHRRPGRRKGHKDIPADAGGHQGHEYACNGYGKPELDAGIETTRSELDGHMVDRRSNGAGIYVPKPELEGTQGCK
ncbi:hypothetical protein F4776DRAFT_676257 [Hypoxylon sp. NC0597]|nr:hypothetical protein F4776DRAFT_676257 [Hypoxylon sp. NC0597]